MRASHFILCLVFILTAESAKGNDNISGTTGGSDAGSEATTAQPEQKQSDLQRAEEEMLRRQQEALDSNQRYQSEVKKEVYI